jgi:hypothetical protein
VNQSVVKAGGSGLPNQRLANALTTTWLTIPARLRMNPSKKM